MEQVGRYQITGELGRGAMGLVYKALDPTIGRVVALKTMRLDVSGIDTGELLTRFRNEARSAGVLHHPNIVTVFDAGEHEGLFYIAMEYIEGQTLQALLAERYVLPADQIIGIAGQICAGLDYAHSRGVVHRDIKPANIMIAGDAIAKIMDFGIAKFGGGITSTGQVLGTPNYMSPEQVKGKSLDGRSDLFSVGVMLYEMLTGEKPFVGQNVTTIIYKIVNETPIPPRELDVTIHPGLSAVVTRALAKSPDERYQSGAELARDLQGYKSFGADEPATLVLSAATLAAAAAAPAPARIPEPAPAERGSTAEIQATDAEPGRWRTGRLYVWLLLVVFALSAVGAVYYGRIRDRLVNTANNALPPAPRPPTPDPRGIAPVGVAGELRVISSPPGAEFTIDGRSAPQWVTPFTATRLQPGTHTVSVGKRGFISQIRVVDVSPGKPTVLDLELPSSSPMLVLNSKPAGAEIMVDDRPTGRMTPAEIAVDEGQHTVVLRKPGFADAMTNATVSQGQRFSFGPALRADNAAPVRRRAAASSASTPRGTLLVRTRPKGAEVLINGFALPRLTPVSQALGAGRYELVIRLDGYKPLKRNIEVTRQQILELNEPLEPQ